MNPIEPYWRTEAPFTVTATATDDLSGVASVELWYRHSYDNSFDTPEELKWENFGWGTENIEQVGQWYWNFTAPKDDGYYEFYSIAVDRAGNVENAPIGADARCAVVDVERWFPYYHFSKDEPNLPCSFYFDDDNDVSNNPTNYDARVGTWWRHYAYIHTVADESRFTIQYWLYYADEKIMWFGHPHNWEPMLVVFDLGNLNRPSEIGWGRHGRIIYHSYDFAKKVGTHPISYVALDSHANYPRMPLEDGYEWTPGERWRGIGTSLSVDDFDLYLVGGRASGVELARVIEQTYGMEDEKTLITYIYKYRYFTQMRLLKGVAQPEPASGAWPEDYPNFGDVAPWLVPDFRGKWIWKHWWCLPRPDRKYEYYGRAWDEAKPDPDREWWTGLIRSPADLHVYDSFGRHVGINYETGEIETQIPGSMFDITPENHQRITIHYPLMDNYRVEIVARENGKYSFYSLYWENLEPVYQVAIENIEVRVGEVHKSYFMPGILATVNIDPDVLNVKSEGKWVTCYIELPEGFDVKNIDISTVRIGTDKGIVRAESNPNYGFVKNPEIKDRDGNGLPEIAVKFDRKALIGIVEVGDQLVLVVGKVGERLFWGQHTIRVVGIK